jgi:hypothetical protein
VKSTPARFPSDRAGVLFTAVVQDRVTEFLDLDALLSSAASAGGES